MDKLETTQILREARHGEKGAVDRLFDVVYRRLRVLAHRQLGPGPSSRTLNTTALVHEAYMKLVDGARSDWNDRNHFFAVAARAMRQIIVDHARGRLAQKRGGRRLRVTLDEDLLQVDRHAAELIAINEALDQLRELNERYARVVELRYFGGLSVEETAAILDVKPRTVKRDWASARAFLYRSLEVSDCDGD